MYATGLFQRQQDDFIQNKELLTDKARERFKVTAIWWSGTSDLLNISVYNYGINDIDTIPVTLEEIFLAYYGKGNGGNHV